MNIDEKIDYMKTPAFFKAVGFGILAAVLVAAFVHGGGWNEPQDFCTYYNSGRTTESAICPPDERPKGAGWTFRGGDGVGRIYRRGRP